MSGGPYRRGKAPERACMPMAQWPELDRSLWQKACTPSDPFDPEGGSRAGYSTASNRKVVSGYGRWLTFLDGRSELDGVTRPTARITPERIRTYVTELQALANSSNTILARLQELGDFAVAIDPHFDRGLLYRLASRIRAKGKPARNKRANLVGSDDLVTLGLALMEGAARLTTGRERTIAFRDGLIIALLALRPMRRRNLAGLALNRTLRKERGRWVIMIPAEETKTREPIEVPWPDLLARPLETYLTEHRPFLAAQLNRWTATVGDALWVSSHGSPMTEMALYDQVRQRTREGLGKDVNLHLFRDAAATTLAILDPEHVRAASSLLGHRSPATTEKYYQQAQSIEAHRQFAAVIKTPAATGQ